MPYKWGGGAGGDWGSTDVVVWQGAMTAVGHCCPLVVWMLDGKAPALMFLDDEPFVVNLGR